MRFANRPYGAIGVACLFAAFILGACIGFG